MFHRQSLCGLSLGLALTLMAGVFRPGEKSTVVPPLEVRAPVEVAISPRENQGAPAVTTAREGSETPGLLP
ncbi:MAG: hypothetical protein NTV55_03000 [Planctomycetota bacterium]|nr:hypothetical protein [Planctomycetota bacterium]RLS40978.1 MAG: hypothetical protein DWH82_01495 [Planctomycetota bacterium]